MAIPSSLLADATATEGQGVEHALSGLTSDLLFGLEAERILPQPVTQQMARATLARALLERIKADTEVREPIAPPDRDRLLEELWQQIDRPPSAQVTHAVVLAEPGTSQAAARALAEAIQVATAGATSSEDFQSRARAVPAGPLKVRVEALPPITADGRAVNLTAKDTAGTAARFDLDFARAANALQSIGQQSEIIQSAFGLHIIRLDQRFPEHRLSQPEIEAALRQALHTERTALEVTQLLGKLNTESKVEVKRSVDDVLRKFTMEP